MILDFIKRLFSPSRPLPRTDQNPASPLGAETRPVTPPSLPREPLPQLLDIGLDIGTSCTKVVVANRESNTQMAVPLRTAEGLSGYLLPTRVFLDGEVFRLEGKADRKRTGLKVQLMSNDCPEEAFIAFTAFLVMVLGRVLAWHSTTQGSRRRVDWHVSLGLPVRRVEDGPIADRYRRCVRAANRLLARGEPLTLQAIGCALRETGPEPRWLPEEHFALRPEASAQLAALAQTPLWTQGPLLVVDVGAGTMDISMFQLGAARIAAERRLSYFACDVAPLGIHALLAAQTGLWHPDRGRHWIAEIDDEGLAPVQQSDQDPTHFREACKHALVPVVIEHRKRLKSVHTSPAFLPFREGLPYVLAGGGRHHPFYRSILERDLEAWLETICREWSSRPQHRPQNGWLQKRSLEAPNTFIPRDLRSHFDRFSVAHGLSLELAGSVEMRIAEG